MECCLHLPPSRHSHENEGFLANPAVGREALKFAGIHAVGIANNVNYGSANIAASIARLDEVGVLHTGAGANLAAARARAIVQRNGLRVGVLQRSSVYWPTDHEARDDAPGIAVLRGHTARQQQRVAIGRRIDDGLGGDVGAATRPVLDDEGLAGPLRKPLTHETRDDVVASARGKPDNPAYRSRRIGLGPSKARGRRQRGSAHNQPQKLPPGRVHGALPRSLDERVIGPADGGKSASRRASYSSWHEAISGRPSALADPAPG